MPDQESIFNPYPSHKCLALVIFFQMAHLDPSCFLGHISWYYLSVRTTGYKTCLKGKCEPSHTSTERTPRHPSIGTFYGKIIWASIILQTSVPNVDFWYVLPVFMHGEKKSYSDHLVLQHNIVQGIKCDLIHLFGILYTAFQPLVSKQVRKIKSWCNYGNNNKHYTKTD